MSFEIHIRTKWNKTRLGKNIPQMSGVIQRVMQYIMHRQQSSIVFSQSLLITWKNLIMFQHNPKWPNIIQQDPGTIMSFSTRRDANCASEVKDAQGLQNASSFHNLMIGIQDTMHSPLHNWADQVKKEWRNTGVNTRTQWSFRLSISWCPFLQL